MDVILHIGAHRTASTSFQAYMRANAPQLQGHGIGFWGPLRTRNGLLTGVIPVAGPVPAARQFDLAAGRIAVNVQKAAQAGLRQIVVSDENIAGAPRELLRAGTLYPDLAPRLGRYLKAFGDSVTRIVFSIRSPELFWSSCLAYGVKRGHRVPGRQRLEQIAAAPRGWQEVIRDIALAAPGVDLMVMTHEELGSLPERRLWQMTDRRVMPPMTHAREWLNRSPDLEELRSILETRAPGTSALLPRGEGRWMPFPHRAQAALRERYADDLFWLRAGADGLATLVGDGRDDDRGNEVRGNENCMTGATGPGRTGTEG